MDDRSQQSRLLLVSMLVLLGTLVLYWLIQGRRVLVPIAVSVLVWQLLNALADAIGKLRFGRAVMPRWLRLALAAVLVVVVAVLLLHMLGQSISALGEAVPRYENRLETLVRQAYSRFGVEAPPTVDEMLGSIDLASLVGTVAGSLLGVVGNVIIVVFFVLFLFMEQPNFPTKLRSLVPDDAKRDRAGMVMQAMQKEIQTYVWIKFLMGLLLGGTTYVTLLAVGLDFAVLWSFLVFLLSFIPTVGTLVGVALPAALAVLQFDTLRPFFIILGVLTPIQLASNNYLEPKLMGKSLNLSPFLIFCSLAIWGAVWGITGAILAVPIMSITLIILAGFAKTRPIAVLMSSDGDLSGITSRFPEEGKA